MIHSTALSRGANGKESSRCSLLIRSLRPAAILACESALITSAHRDGRRYHSLRIPRVARTYLAKIFIPSFPRYRPSASVLRTAGQDIACDFFFFGRTCFACDSATRYSQITRGRGCTRTPCRIRYPLSVCTSLLSFLISASAGTRNR